MGRVEKTIFPYSDCLNRINKKVVSSVKIINKRKCVIYSLNVCCVLLVPILK